jgi:hypothetical protein
MQLALLQRFCDSPLQVVDELTREGVMSARASAGASDTNGAAGSSLMLGYPANSSSSSSSTDDLDPGFKDASDNTAAPTGTSQASSSANGQPSPASTSQTRTPSAGASSSSQGDPLGAAPQGAGPAPAATGPAASDNIAALGASSNALDLYMIVSAANPNAAAVLPGELVYLKWVAWPGSAWPAYPCTS